MIDPERPIELEEMTDPSRATPPSPLIVGSKARDDWIRWQEDWVDYSTILDISSKPPNMQLALFRVALGPEAKRLLRHQPAPIDADGTPMDTQPVSTLIWIMEVAVVGEVNDTYERYVFRCRMQRDDDTVDEFITALRELIKTCSVCRT